MQEFQHVLMSYESLLIMIQVVIVSILLLLWFWVHSLYNYYQLLLSWFCDYDIILVYKIIYYIVIVMILSYHDNNYCDIFVTGALKTSVVYTLPSMLRCEAGQSMPDDHVHREGFSSWSSQMVISICVSWLSGQIGAGYWFSRHPVHSTVLQL